MSVVTLDLETTSLDWINGRINLLGYRIDGGEITQYEPTGIDEKLSILLSNEESILRGHNIKFDAHFLRQMGYVLRCRYEDTRVMAYHQWPDEENHDLKGLVQRKLGRTPTELGDIVFEPLKKERYHLDSAYSDFYYKMDMGWVRKDLLKEYHLEDITNVDDLRAIMAPSDWFTDIEMPLTKMIYEMEAFGCPLDLEHLGRLKDELSANQITLFAELGGSETFNPGSTPQVAKRLEDLGYILSDITTKTAKGAWQINAPLLKKLAHKGDKFAETLLKYKRNNKLLSTYVDPFIEKSRLDKRLHGSFNQAGSEDAEGDGTRGTKTGRLSSTDPNLQNIPSRTKEGKEIRKAFIAPEEEFEFDSDLKQIEPRLIGHYSQSPKLIYAYNNNLDTHGLFACDIFNRNSVTELTAMERFIGKTSWLATVYGCSFRKLLQICTNFSEGPLDIDTRRFDHLWGWLPLNERAKLIKKYGKESESLYPKWMFFKEVQDNFKRKNPEIMSWRDGHIQRTKRLGYVITIGGRIIKINGLDSTDFKIRFKAEREAVNFLVQGSAADIMKMIMVQFQIKMVDTGKARCFAVIHDELLGSLRNKEGLAGVKDVMENTIKLRNIPIESDSKIITNWGDKG